MGCDIHIGIETYDAESKHWDAFAGVHDRDRWYALFSQLANVRTGEEVVDPVAANRGLPLDADAWWETGEREIDGDVWLGDHSHTWCTPDEFETALNRVSSPDGNEDECYRRLIAVCRTLEVTRKVRLLIGFDS